MGGLRRTVVRRTAAAGLALGVAGARPAAAQPADTARLEVGDRVRVTDIRPYQPFLLRGPRSVVGTLTAQSDSQLIVRPAQGAPVTLPTDSVARIEVSQGQMTPPEGWVYGFKRGALLGLVGAAPAPLISGRDPATRNGALLMAATVVTGAAVGMMYNGLIHLPERWETVLRRRRKAH